MPGCPGTPENPANPANPVKMKNMGKSHTKARKNCERRTSNAQATHKKRGPTPEARHSHRTPHHNSRPTATTGRPTAARQTQCSARPGWEGGTRPFFAPFGLVATVPASTRGVYHLNEGLSLRNLHDLQYCLDGLRTVRVMPAQGPSNSSPRTTS